MDNEANGLADWFLARHTTDPVLLCQLLSNFETWTSHRPTGRVTENALRGELLPRAAFLPPCISNCIVESMGSTNNSRLAEEEGVARATARMRRVMEERAERERFRREINRREKGIREQRARERMERGAREMVAASSWPQQQEAISGLDEKITRNIICGNCGRQKYVSRSSLAITDFSNGLSTPVLEQCVLESCPLVEAGVLREREDREQSEGKIERKEREIREQRARRRRGREARVLEEASRWPQQQEAITVPWCACRYVDEEAAQGSEQYFEALSEPQQETFPRI